MRFRRRFASALSRPRSIEQSHPVVFGRRQVIQQQLPGDGALRRVRKRTQCDPLAQLLHIDG